MNKFIFDSNIFDKFIDDDIKLNLINTTRHNIYYVTHIQYDQLKVTPDIKRRKRLLGVFKKIPQLKLPTESFILGVSRLGQGKLGSGADLKKILGNKKQNPRNFNDALVGEVALKNNLILVSDDKSLRNSIIRLGGVAITFTDFIDKTTG